VRQAATARQHLFVDRADDVADVGVLAPQAPDQLGLGQRGIRIVVFDLVFLRDHRPRLFGQNI